MNPYLFQQPVYPLLDLEAADRSGRDPFAIVADWRSRALFSFQLRAKQLREVEYLRLSERLVTRFADARIIANDFVAAALAHRELFTGVHLGQADWRELDPAHRERLRLVAAESAAAGKDGQEFFTGFSTHNPGQLVAALNGVDANNAKYPAWSYIALGPMAATVSKHAGLWPVLAADERRQCSDIFADFFRREIAAGLTARSVRPRPVCIGGLIAENLVEALGDWSAPGPEFLPLPAVIQAALDLESLDRLIKNVALLARKKSLET